MFRSKDHFVEKFPPLVDSQQQAGGFPAGKISCGWGDDEDDGETKKKQVAWNLVRWEEGEAGGTEGGGRHSFCRS